MSTCKWSMKTKGQQHNPVSSGRHTVAPVDHSLNLLSHSVQADRESKPVLEEEYICNGEHWWASLARRETPCRRCSWLPSWWSSWFSCRWFKLTENTIKNAPYIPPDLRPIATRGGGGGGGEAGSPWSGQPVACSDCHQELMTMMWQPMMMNIYEDDDSDDNDNGYENDGDDDDDPVFLAAQWSARRGQFEERGGRGSSCVSSSDPKRRHPLMLIVIVIASCVTALLSKGDVILRGSSPPSSTDCFSQTGFSPLSTHIELSIQRWSSSHSIWLFTIFFRISSERENLWWIKSGNRIIISSTDTTSKLRLAFEVRAC